MAHDGKDKVIAALAIGFLLVTTLSAIQTISQFERYGVRPVVHLTEFRVDYRPLCDGRIAMSFALTNTGRDGFVQIAVLADDVGVYTNNYRVVRGETRQVAEFVFFDDCTLHEFRAEVTATWA